MSEQWASLCPCPNSECPPQRRPLANGQSQMPHYYYITQYMQRQLFPWSVHYSNNHTNLNTRKALRNIIASKATENSTQLPDLTQMPHIYNCGWFCINADSPRSMRGVLSGCYCYCSSAICKLQCKCWETDSSVQVHGTLEYPIDCHSSTVYLPLAQLCSCVVV